MRKFIYPAVIAMSAALVFTGCGKTDQETEKTTEAVYVSVDGIDTYSVSDLEFENMDISGITPDVTGDEDEVYGYMLEDAPEGTWIHNHNMGCDRGKV